jgi:hypothetical protein
MLKACQMANFGRKSAQAYLKLRGAGEGNFVYFTQFSHEDMSCRGGRWDLAADRFKRK